MRILELFAGIGGVAAAVAGRAEVVCAVDQDPYAHSTYIQNHPHPAHRWNIAGLRAPRLKALKADLWWASPPCQPFTVRGARRDLDDPRSRAFIRLLELIEELTPAHLALENVPGFQGSRAHAALMQLLHRAGYHVAERRLCPGALGVPNKRDRYYLLASKHPIPAWRPIIRQPRPLTQYLDPDPDPALYLSAELIARYDHALAVTDLDHPDPQTFCYTAAYGRSPVYAGSYLRDAGGIRRLSPEEILRLLHFPASFRFPPSVPTAQRYKLAGNSLSVLAVQELLRPLLGPDP